MNYDKNSFLSGIAVGRQLKGWASGVNAQDDPSAAAAFAAVPVVPLQAGTVPGAYGGEISVLGILHFGDLVEFAASAIVTAGGLSAAVTAGAALAGVNEYGLTAAGLTGNISGNITAEATLEVEE